MTELSLSGAAVGDMADLVYHAIVGVILCICALGFIWVTLHIARRIFSPKKWIWGVVRPSEKFLALVLIVSAVGGITATITFAWEERREIMRANEADYAASRELIATLMRFETAALAASVKLDQEFVGAWRPLSLESALSDSMRSVLERHSLFSWIQEEVPGRIQTDVLGSCSILTLQSGDRTLFVVLVNPKAVRLFLVETLEEWQKGYRSGSYCQTMLENFERLGPLAENQLFANQTFVGNLKSACQEPLIRRTFVRVRGAQITEDVVIATELDVGNTRTVFFPSGYIEAFGRELRPLIEKRPSAALGIAEQNS